MKEGDYLRGEGEARKVCVISGSPLHAPGNVRPAGDVDLPGEGDTSV